MIREYVVKVTDDVRKDGFEIFEAMWAPECQIVRCKYCKHATMTSDGKLCKWCDLDRDEFDHLRSVYREADWFCADGEPKGE